MRTLTEKYNGVLEGTFTKDQFLRDARMELPNFITQHNSYPDAVNILLNKGLISEGMTDDEWQAAKESDRLKAHPERKKIQATQRLVRKERGTGQIAEQESEVHKLSSLTWDKITDILPTRPGLAFPAGGDVMNMIKDGRRFEEWKQETMSKFGDADIKLDPKAVWSRQVVITGDAFAQHSKDSSASKQSFLDRNQGPLDESSEPDQLNVVFNDPEDYIRAKQWFSEESDFYPSSEHDEFFTLSFEVVDQADADATERAIDQELSGTDIQSWRFEIMGDPINEATPLQKIFRKIGWGDDSWTPQDYARQIKNLSDSTLKIWYDDAKKNKGIPNTPLAFQQKLTRIEMEKRGLIEPTHDINEDKSPEFKKGDKVTYLGHPAEITLVGQDAMGRTHYSVSYNKGQGRTKASNIYNKGGEIKTTIKEKIGMFNDPIGFKKPELADLDKVFTKEYKGNGTYTIYKNGKIFKTGVEGEGNANALINAEIRKLEGIKEEVDPELLDVVQTAMRISKEEGVVQHVNELPGGRGYTISDFYDSDSTVVSFENGRKLNESQDQPLKRNDIVRHIPSGVEMRISVIKPRTTSGVVLKAGNLSSKLRVGDVEQFRNVELGATWEKVNNVSEAVEPLDQKIPLNTLEHGIRFELDKKGLDTSPTVDEYEKAKKAALKNLHKDLMFYRRAEGAKDMPVSKTDQMVKMKLKEGIKQIITKILTEDVIVKKTFTLGGKLK